MRGSVGLPNNNLHPGRRATATACYLCAAALFVAPPSPAQENHVMITQRCIARPSADLLLELGLADPTDPTPRGAALYRWATGALQGWDAKRGEYLAQAGALPKAKPPDWVSLSGIGEALVISVYWAGVRVWLDQVLR